MLIITTTSILLLASLSGAKDVSVKVRESDLINVVDEIFHGVAMDSSLFTINGLRPSVNLGSQKLRNLLKALSPAYFRVGGTAANWVFFDLPPPILGPLKLEKATILTRKLFDDLVNITLDTGNRLLFDVNAELRYGQAWNPSDFIRLLEYCKQEGYGQNIDWELGNEPNHISPSNLTVDQVANDTVIFHKIIKMYSNLENSSIIGPGVGWMGVKYIGKVADVAGQYLTAYSIHQYYFDGRTATVDDYVNASYFKNLDKLFNKIRFELHNSTHEDKAWWLGETSGGYGSGTKGVSDRFASGFLYLEKLGFSAANNVDVVIRQTIFNGYYGLLDLKTFDPFPDYWLIWVHHHLVGRGVFNVTLDAPNDSIRVYAQCSKNGAGYSKGSITLFALNVDKNETWTLNFKSKWFSGKIEAFVMTPGNNGLLSKKVYLNKRLLKMTGEKLAKFPKIGVTVDSINVKPLTFGFYVFKEADVKLCY